jgi:hypothetical protein
MQKIILGLTSCLLLAACVTRYEQPRPYVVAPPPPPMQTMPQAQPAPAYVGARECREFQQTIVVNGQEQPGYGKACRQPDGTWKIVE